MLAVVVFVVLVVLVYARKLQIHEVVTVIEQYLRWQEETATSNEASECSRE